MLGEINKKIVASLDALNSGVPWKSIDFLGICRQIRKLYEDDVVFRLRFDNVFRYGLIREPDDQGLAPLAYLVSSAGESLLKKNWVFPQLFCFHIHCDLENSDLLEIGGYLPPSVIDLFGVRNYTGSGLNEDIRNLYRAGSESNCSSSFVNIDIQDPLQVSALGKYTRIFSTACFEHILDLEAALDNCYQLIGDIGYLYSYIAPVWTFPLGGQHGYVDPDVLPGQQNQFGFHLLPVSSQISILKSKSINKGLIEKVLCRLHFNDDVNERPFEYYQRALTESKFLCLKLDQIQNLNISKLNPGMASLIRKSYPDSNLTTSGIRVLLSKGVYPPYLENSN